MAKKHTEEFVQKIILLYKSGVVQTDIAIELGLSKHTVKRVLSNNLSKDEKKAIIESRQICNHDFFLNKEYGRLTIKKWTRKKEGIAFECECKCGRKGVVLPKNWVITGNTQSCGCLGVERIIKFGEICGKYWTKVQKSAFERGIEFNLDIRDAWAIFVKQERKCAVTGVELFFAKNYSKDYSTQTASLDRINNSIGYNLSNIQWVHKKFNSFRGSMGLDAIYSLAKRINDQKRKLDISLAFNRWDVKYLSLAEFVSHWSKDESTKVGAVLFDKNFRPISFGYNGLPQQIYDRKDWLSNRDIKYKTIIHAEVNAIIFSKGVDLTDASIATWPFMPCSNCASLIAQSGIRRVVSINNDNPRWQESFNLSKEIFKAKNIELKLYDNFMPDVLWT